MARDLWPLTPVNDKLHGLAGNEPDQYSHAIKVCAQIVVKITQCIGHIAVFTIKAPIIVHYVIFIVNPTFFNIPVYLNIW